MKFGRVFAMVASLLFVGCGADQPTAYVSPYDVMDDPGMAVDGYKYYGKSWSNRRDNFVKDNDDGLMGGKDWAGERANTAREYSYTRGIEEMRHGDNSSGPSGKDGESGAKGTQGKDGTNGADGDRGPEGSAGVPGEDGAAGEKGATGDTGAQGPAGDDFDGDERLTEVEDRLETLESIVATQGELITALSEAVDAGDAELADALNDLDNELSRTKRKLRKLKWQTRRDIRRLMWFIMSTLRNQRPTYDIDIDIDYEDNDTYTYEDNDTNVEVDARTIYNLRNILIAIMECSGNFSDCEVDDVELDD